LLLLDKLYSLDLMKKYFLPDGPEEKLGDMKMKVTIDRYTLVGDAVVYYVRLRNQEKGAEEWVFKARYSELRNVHESLVESKINNLPPFPRKKVFGITNENPDNIEKRREEL
jgi:hypothetical protein